MLIALFASNLSLASAATAPVGNGFVVTAGDLSFILKQIRIAERHAATLTPANPCGTLVGTDVDQIPDRLTSYGLRTVDGSCNNLFPGREKFAAADVPFPRLTTPVFKDAEPITPAFPVGPPGPTSYKQKLAGNVVIDSEPRIISNLIVDQTSTNPAAIAAAAFPVRSQGNPGLFPCTTDPDPTANPPVDGVPAGCVPSHQTLFIPNVTTDVGLSPPFNSMFTFFGQFFDHGVDQTVKSGGTVFVPLRADDPLRTLGPDGKAGTGDEVPASRAFMVLTRAQNQPGPDGVLGTADDIQDANNTDSPWVDQSQTYTSHASHQVFLREYALNGAGRPISTGRLLGGLPAGLTYSGSPNGQTGISTWASTKKQAKDLLGLLLQDKDVLNIPMIAADPYGNFIPGPARGLPQYVTTTGLVEGDRTNPVAVPANVRYFDTPFLTDIAHNADPSPQDTDNNPATPPVVPVPDADNTPSADFAHQPAGTYDDEMLNAHFTCGDGRCNENIALSAIHQIFHSEHDRLVADITNTLNANPTLLADFQAAHPFGASADISFGFGGRLFQAARFVTEMEYQHLVFEEFARKVQPAVRPFHVFSPDINAAVEAEFAHAVYRFGHSMLDDDVARVGPDLNANGTLKDHSLPLLTAFLNPPEYFNGGSAGTYTPEQAAGAIIMGSSDQVGNEIDEFVTEVLRNNLLGLPLDLPTLNMTRARDAGIPPLNQVRRDIFAQTNDGQLAPYTDWSDFGNHLKHPESLINFVAAYGQHPTILAATTLTAKRLAARAIVDPQPAKAGPDGILGTADDIPADVPPADAADFMFSNGPTWANVGGKTVTGLDKVDLWVGGLAEVTNLFGGLLGSTFNYVFQSQLEKLQDGDRLYYLARTPGMNLRTQLEGNSFSEMIQRNTDGTNTLKADAFATADCKFQMANLAGTAAGFTSFGSIVADDASTPDCNESLLLQRSPDGTIAYKQRNTVDPTGINGQAVYNGTPGADRIKGGNDNDTFWGGLGNDVIDGQGGDDVALGGEGDDILTDLDGADVPKGGPGNDAIDAGPGDDIPMGNAGQDFINGGANDNETFAGEGNDFIIAGQGADAVFGDGGDDWIEGGSGQDLLQGDHGAPFFDDPAEAGPGNDLFIGQVGENDYDAEGGDDVMAQNSFVDRNAGGGGYDWAFHQYNTAPADDDMEINNNLPGLPIQVVVNRDRWQETEADAGAGFNDSIKGTSVAPATLGGAGFSGCDALDPAGVARIAGLNRLVTTFPSALPPIVAASPSRYCPLAGDNPALAGVQSMAIGQGNVWGEGDILLGGGGSDVIEGRGADDIIDGDHTLRIRISVRAGVDANGLPSGAEIASTDLMENAAITGSFYSGALASTTLQAAVFAGKVNPGQLVATREIVAQDGSQLSAAPNASTGAPSDCGAAAPVNCDTAVFSGPRANYTVVRNANGSITVSDAATVAVDGTDTLWNIEQVRFSDQTVNVGAPAAPTIGTALAGNGQATVNWTPAAAPLSPVTSFQVQVLLNGTTTQVGALRLAGANATSLVVTGLTNGTAYQFRVQAVNAVGAGPFSAASNAVTPAAAPAPVVINQNPANGATGVPVGANITFAFSQAVQGVNATNVTLRNTATNALVPAAVTGPVAGVIIANANVTINPNADLAPNTSYTVTITGGTCTAPATGIRRLVTPCVAVATTTWTFTTAAANAAPVVTARTPAINAVNVLRASTVTATFSQDVQGISATTATINRNGAAIAATVTYNAATRTLTITPAAALRRNTQFTVILTGGPTAIRSLLNVPLTTVSWSFTTGAN
jgi:methionine-rich copper-binding protein CopC